MGAITTEADILTMDFGKGLLPESIFGAYKTCKDYPAFLYMEQTGQTIPLTQTKPKPKTKPKKTKVINDTPTFRIEHGHFIITFN